ncbi:reverse transcriptase [Phytophthora megakarya]|uniref:Reverse transcriptase n=1 Tax=Phytophthora megakarya TaxID=4795 RepID=A0A225W182_9STRA|nr:reverse transcriptase [Phytophthora megakarya]
MSEISEVEDETTDGPTGGPQKVLDNQDSDEDEFFDSISVDDGFLEVNLEDIPRVEPEDDVFSDLPVSVMACTPVQQLELEYERVMQLKAEELNLEPAVYIHEGSETLSQLREQLALLPDIKELSPKCDIDSADVGESGTSTPEDERKLRAVLKYHRVIFLGDGNAVPAPARGVTCDLDVGEANPVAQRPRSVAPHLSIKVYKLLKKRLETRLVEHSELSWASPIVIVLKKKWCGYPNDVMGFMSLDMASGFWAIKKAERAKLISAFICPFGHFQWTRMPFGLKNAPLIYQSVINNYLWGFVRLPLQEEAEVDQDVLDFLGLDSTDNQESESGGPRDEVKGLADSMTVFQRNILMPSHIGPVLGRSSYIDDIAHGAKKWDQLCEDLDIYREFGKQSIPYPSHEISAEGIRATPNIAKGVTDIPFPKSHKDTSGMRPFTAHESFELLKRKTVATPMLRHPDIQTPFVIIWHANRWAACAVVGQEYDGKIQPVRYTGRSKSADGRCVPWGVKLSHWDIEIRKVQKDEDGLAAIMGAGITPREHLDEAVETLIPLKGHVRRPPVVSVEMLGSDFQGVVLSFDGAAKLLHWLCVMATTRLEAKGFLLENVTVNDAEYHGRLTGLEMAIEMRLQDLVAVGDSRIVIQQVQGLINCNQPHLQTHLAKVEVLKKKFGSLRLVHLKRENNQAADYLTTKTLILDESWDVTDTAEIAHLEHVSKIAEKLMKVEDSDRKSGVDPTYGEIMSRDVEQPTAESAPLTKSARVLAAVTCSRSQAESTSRDQPMDPLEFQAERWRRIRVHQEADEYLSEIKDFLKEDFEKFSPRRLRKVAIVADLFVLDTRDVLYRLARSTRGRPRDFQDEPRLVVPKALRDDVLHYGHDDGHQGITRTHKRLCSEFYWPGMYANVEHFVKECVDCASGKGKPPNAGPSPGNTEPRRPFEVVSMDFVTHMPTSDRGNTFWLLFQDMFSGYMVCKPMDSTTAQDVAEAYEERVFRNLDRGQ